jgi:RNA polymerase sigma factor (sigma-70 family)
MESRARLMRRSCAYLLAGGHRGVRPEHPVVIGVQRAVEKVNTAVQAATAVFAEHGEFIRTVIRFQAGKRLDIEDLCQEFYLALIRQPVPADVTNVQSYLYRALVHHVIDAVRRRKSYSRILKKYTEETRISINNRPAGNALVDEEQRNAAVTCLAGQLQDRQAQAFILRYRDDCSLLEIAMRMGINKRTVSRYLSESLRKLRGTPAME